jgi:hypothetical protein
MVPRELSFLCRYPFEAPFYIFSQSAVTQTLLRDPAFIHAKIAGDTLRILWWLRWKSKGGPAFFMSLRGKGQGLSRSFPYTIEASAKLF